MTDSQRTRSSGSSGTGTAALGAERRDSVAVALGYDPASGRAPTILASGRGTIAEQILNIAFAEGIKVREDADLAQLLSVVDVDSEIPVEAMAAVAEILSYVYRANRRIAGDAESEPAGPATPDGTAPGWFGGAPWRGLFDDEGATDPAGGATRGGHVGPSSDGGESA